MWMACAQRRRTCAYTVEMLGITLPSGNQNRAFTWESASHILCIERNWNYPHTTPHEVINEPDVYRRFIWLLFDVGIVKTLNPEESKPGRF